VRPGTADRPARATDNPLDLPPHQEALHAREHIKIHRRPAVLHDLTGHINAMLQAEPTTRTIEIWRRLHDEHDATPSYPAIRAYVSTYRLVHRQT